MVNPSTFQVYNASAGSGKTFTLVKEYLKIILGQPDSRMYQQILAITFTNKAASEMKDRILENLLQFSTMHPEDPENDMMLVLMSETGLEKTVIQIRSRERLQDILKNYSSFHIKTIDSFNNKLIKSFAFDLGLTSDFEVELEADLILKEAIDAVLSQIGQDPKLTRLLVSFSKQKTLEDKSWDISKDLFEVSRLILNENHAEKLDKLKDKPISQFSELSKKLRQQQIDLRNQLGKIGNEALDVISEAGLAHEDFARSQFPKFFQKLTSEDPDFDFSPEASLSKNIAQRNFYTKGKAAKVGPRIDRIADQLISAYETARKVFERYKLNELILKQLVPLAVINAINKALEEIKTNNNIRLNAEFNQMISEHLIKEPAPFIYEKLGEKFKYFFIDEMQDTSVLQWQNLIPLIENALSSENGGLMLVGDAKQAIYRWRGGRAEQFIELSSEDESVLANPFHLEKTIRNLDTNFRSFSEVISFNNRFFSHISRHFSDPGYTELYLLGNQQEHNAKQGGYVSLQFQEALKNNQERELVYPKLVHETIVKLLDQFEPGDICVLVRKKKEGVAIAKYLTELGMDIVSSETLLLKNNEKVNFIIALLEILADENNKDAAFIVLNFLYDHLALELDRHQFLEGLIHLSVTGMFSGLEVYGIRFSPAKFKEYAIIEGVEYIIRNFGLAHDSDAFLQFFLDFVFDYSQRKSQKNTSFLAYWEEKKDKLNIVSSEEVKAVRIMTIHKSKGLEFPVVIFPYNLDLYYEKSPKAWYPEPEQKDFNELENILVDSSSGIKKTGPRGTLIFEEQRREKELDSFNLLYVCLTRAVEQLYVISETKTSKNALSSSAELFEDFLRSEGLWQPGVLEYDFGDKSRNSQKKISLNQAEVQKDFISSSWKEDHQIHIVANSELLWDRDRAEAIGYGNLIHEMMEKILTHADVEKVLTQFIYRGLVSETEKDDLRRLLLNIVQHPDLSRYFIPGMKVINEREILTESGHVLIPDRLVIEGNRVTVIDYKTGKPHKDHLLQIENYGLVLQKLNYEVLDKILVYIDKGIKVIKS